MNVFDWIFIAGLALGFVLGIIKGFLKPLLSAIGFVVVAFGSSLLTPTVQGWLMGVQMSDDLRPLLAMVVAIVGLTIVWVLISLILRKIITARKGMGAVNRIVGAVLGVVMVYLVFAIIVAFVVGPLGGLLPFITDKLKPEVEASWVRLHIYTDGGNFFGNWIIGSMAEKIVDIIQGSQNPEAIATAVRYVSALYQA